jgi:hypothetical protein
MKSSRFYCIQARRLLAPCICADYEHGIMYYKVLTPTRPRTRPPRGRPPCPTRKATGRSRRCALSSRPVSEPALHPRYDLHSQLPFGWPTAYSISVGWNTSELDRGAQRDGHGCAGGAVRPVPRAYSASGSTRFALRTVTICFRQCVWSTADTLQGGVSCAAGPDCAQAHVANTPARECTSIEETPCERWSHVSSAPSRARRSQSLTSPSKLHTSPSAPHPPVPREPPTSL